MCARKGLSAQNPLSEAFALQIPGPVIATNIYIITYAPVKPAYNLDYSILAFFVNDNFYAKRHENDESHSQSLVLI